MTTTKVKVTFVKIKQRSLKECALLAQGFSRIETKNRAVVYARREEIRV